MSDVPQSRSDLIAVYLSARETHERMTLRLLQLERRLLTALCPYQVGETIDVKGPAYRGQRGVVASLSLTTDAANATVGWRVTVRILRGPYKLPGRRTATWSNQEDA